MINKDNIFAALFIDIILLAGIILAAPKGLLSIAFVIYIIVVVTSIVLIASCYFPIKGYVILMKCNR